MKTLFTLFTVLSLGAVIGQTNCSQIFISEYVEGWSNNKALEIYNPTSAPVNLSQFFVARYSNGSSTATVGNAIQLSGTIAPHSVYVAVLEKLDPNGVGQEAPVWDSLQSRADGFYCPDYAVSNCFYWNGNDAVMLAKGTLPSTASTLINAANVTGFQIIDLLGKIGENPANETGSTSNNDGAWSSQFPYSTGLGNLVTKDHSMIRKSTIQKGVATQPSFFDPLLEYDSIPAVIVRLDANGDTLFGTSGNPILDGNWNSLGVHDCLCNPAGINETENPALLVYPNPSSGLINLKNSQEVKSIQLINALGQQVAVYNNLNKPFITLELDGNKGVYFLKISMKNGSSEIRRVILK
jgi:hypothetical protein